MCLVCGMDTTSIGNSTVKLKLVVKHIKTEHSEYQNLIYGLAKLDERFKEWQKKQPTTIMQELVGLMSMKAPARVNTEIGFEHEESRNFMAPYLSFIQRKLRTCFLVDDKYLKNVKNINLLTQAMLYSSG